MKWYQICLIVLAGLPATFIIYNLFLTVCGLLVNPHKEYETDSKFYRRLLVGATWLLMKFCKIHTEVVGREKLPEGRYLMVQNHRSKFDPMISWVVFDDQKLAFVSKPKNFKVFTFGRFIRKCAFMAIDREDPRKAMKTIQKAARLMKNDVVSVAIYPEGTRNYTRELLPFKSGCFKAAKMAEVPVAVVAVEGGQRIHKNAPWKRSDVRFTVCDVITAEDVKALKTQEIGDRARQAMENVLNKEDY